MGLLKRSICYGIAILLATGIISALATRHFFIIPIIYLSLIFLCMKIAGDLKWHRAISLFLVYLAVDSFFAPAAGITTALFTIIPAAALSGYFEFWKKKKAINK